MRRVTFSSSVLSALAVLLLGCERPLAPGAMPDVVRAARGSGSQLAPPSNVTAVVTSGSTIVVSWQDNSSNESRFEVLRSHTGPAGTYNGLVGTGENVTSYTDTGLSQGVQYCYLIRAVLVRPNGVSSSTSSSPACGMIPLPAVPPPSAAYATNAKPLDGLVVVNWTAVGLSFRIDRSTDGGVAWDSAGTVYDARYFYDRAVRSEQQVCYRVVNYNEAGSAAPSISGCTTPPAAPSGLTVTAADPQTLQLTWIDNSAVEDGYEVWEHTSQAPCGGYDSGTSEGDNLVARLPANTITYRTPGVLGEDLCGYSHWLEVRATRDGGYVSGVGYYIDR